MKTNEPVGLSQSHDAISQRAAVFFERRRFGGWSVADQAELDAWLAESFSHRAAFLRLEGAVAHTEHLVIRHPRAFREDASDSHGGFRYRRFVLPLLAAASIALIAALGIPYVASLMQPPDRIDSTSIGGRTLVSFSDHTQIELNTNTAMRFRMTTAERTVWLEKGEAWFHIAHDAAHPFAVIVGKHRITDLGTEFVVRRDADDVRVSLLNGRASLNAAGIQTATLNPGDEATATPVSLSVNRKTPQELADELAWRRGMLVFRNARLADVVKEFNRYNATKLVIADPSIADVKVYAELKTDDYEDLLQLVQTMIKLRVDREGSVILISRSQRKETKRAARVEHSL
jgi:transmembrane sensor